MGMNPDDEEEEEDEDDDDEEEDDTDTDAKVDTVKCTDCQRIYEKNRSILNLMVDGGMNDETFVCGRCMAKQRRKKAKA